MTKKLFDITIKEINKFSIQLKPNRMVWNGIEFDPGNPKEWPENFDKFLEECKKVYEEGVKKDVEQEYTVNKGLNPGDKVYYIFDRKRKIEGEIVDVSEEIDRWVEIAKDHEQYNIVVAEWVRDEHFKGSGINKGTGWMPVNEVWRE